MAVVLVKTDRDFDHAKETRRVGVVHHDADKNEELKAQERRIELYEAEQRGTTRKEFTSYTDFGQVGAANKVEQGFDKRHLVNIMLIISKVMEDINQNDEAQVLTGTKEVEVQNAELKKKNASLSGVQKNIDAQITKLENPPHQHHKWWQAIVGIVVGLVVGVALAAISGGVGAALAPEAAAVAEGAAAVGEGTAAVTEGATAVEESTALAETSVDSVGTQSETAAQAGGYARTSAVLSSNLTKMALLMGAMSAGGAVGNMYQQKAAAEDSNASEVVNANLSKYQVEMQKIINDLQRAENESQNTFQLLVSNPQQQMNMASSQFSQALSSWVSATNASFQG